MAFVWLNKFPIFWCVNGSQNFIKRSLPPETIKDLDGCQSTVKTSLPCPSNIFSS